jgi:hypothetical protein
MFVFTRSEKGDVGLMSGSSLAEISFKSPESKPEPV